MPVQNGLNKWLFFPKIQVISEVNKGQCKVVLRGYKIRFCGNLIALAALFHGSFIGYQHLKNDDLD